MELLTSRARPAPIDELSSAHLRRALRLIGELGEIRELREYPAAVASGLCRLIPCEQAGCDVLDLRSRPATEATNPGHRAFDDGAARPAPAPDLAARRREFHALRRSDFVSRGNLRRADLYRDLYRLIPHEYQLGLILAPGTATPRVTEVVALSLGRERHDFAEHHVALLDAVAPHLASARRRLEEIALLRASAVGDPDHGSRWLMLVDGTGTLVWSTPATARTFGLTPGLPLPLELARTAAGPAGPPQAVSLLGTPLLVTVIPDAYPGLDALRLEPVGEGATSSQLRSLGLTCRQAEILQLAVMGATSAQIATQLSLSRRTVEKHFEAIYARVGAANRTQAIIEALRVRRLPPPGGPQATSDSSSSSS